jgi:hypothetical protein
MKKTVIILSAIIQTMTISLTAQTILPDKSTRIDKSKVKQCQKEIDNIDAMQLKCDTIYACDKAPRHLFKGVYLDEKSLLRKYVQKIIVNDGSHESMILSAYYDKNGNLVYITINTSSNCDDNIENYYIHKGRIIDFRCELYCDCCEKDRTEEEISLIRPVVGNTFIKAINWNLTLTNFIHADTLLKTLENTKYDLYGEFEPL